MTKVPDDLVMVRDRMQGDYHYVRSAPWGADFDTGFAPELTPPEMLELGIFCGKYMTDCRGEFPESWFTRARLADGPPDCALNHYGVRAGTSLSVWRARGWIHPDDPRGWFQWYCRYHSGRRMDGEDERQIGRWRAFRRHAAQVAAHCDPGDPFCRPRQRQALLQWAYDSRAL